MAKKRVPVKQNKPVPKAKVQHLKKGNSKFLFLSGFMVFLLPLILYLFYPCLKNDFSNWDDPTYIENNPLIKDFSGNNLKRIFTEIYFSNYQPLHIFSYLVEYHFFKLDPYGYHLVSVLLHAAVTLMVSWLSMLLFEKKSIALVTGLLFAVHPMHIESIAWASERKDLLYAFFFFASLIAWIYYVKSSGHKSLFFLSFLLFVLSVFSKAMAASLPPVLVLLDFYFKRPFSKKLVFEKLPFFILAFIMGSVSVYASSRDNSIDTNTTFNFFDRLLFANSNLLMYFVKLLIPFQLCSYYPYPDKTDGLLPLLYYLSPAVVLIILGLMFYSLRYNRVIFTCLGFFILTVFLVLQLLPVGPNIFAERYSYIPSASFFMLIGFALSLLAEKSKATPSVRYIVYGCFSVYCIWLSMITPQRCMVWKNPETIWSDVIKKFDRVPIAYNNRGHFLNKSGRKQEAMNDFNKALELNADYDMALFNRGSLYGEMSRFEESMRDLSHAIRLNEKFPEAYKMRGQVYAVTGKGDQALADFKKALEIKPDYAEIYYNIGVFYFNAGKQNLACENFLKASELKDVKGMEMAGKYCK